MAETEQSHLVPPDTAKIAHESMLIGANRFKVGENMNLSHRQFLNRSQWSLGRPTQFAEDRARVHIGLRTTRDRVGPTFLQKGVVDHTYDTSEPQHSVTVRNFI